MPFKDKREPVVGDTRKSSVSVSEKTAEIKEEQQKRLQAREPFICYNCHKPRHIVVQCTEAKIVFFISRCK